MSGQPICGRAEVATTACTMKPVPYKDPFLLLLAVLLLISLAAFIGGLMPYPYGVLVLTIFLLARVMHLHQL